MCLHIDCVYHSNLKPHTATKDIKVYKVLLDTPVGLRSPYHNMLWIPKKTRKSTMDVETLLYEVEKGLHSYTSFISARNFMKNLNCLALVKEIEPNAQVFHAIIPRGAEYYSGMRNDMVSTKLKIIAPVKIEELV